MNWYKYSQRHFQPEPKQWNIKSVLYVEEDEDIAMLSSVGIQARLGQERPVQIDYDISFEEGIRGDQGTGSHYPEMSHIKIIDAETGIDITQAVQIIAPDTYNMFVQEAWDDSGYKPEEDYSQEHFRDQYLDI